MDYPNNRGYHNNGGYQNNQSFQPERNPSPPFASTPLIARSRPPRFAYSGPPNYPRPGSSATKPNPNRSFSELMRSRYVPSGTMSDSMMNNCGDSMQYMDSTSPDDDISFMSEYNRSDSFQSQNSTLYYSCNDSFGDSPRKTFPLLERPFSQQAPMNSPHNFQSPQQTSPNRPVHFQSPPVPNSKNRFKAASSVLDAQQRKPKPYYKKPKSSAQKSDWRCELCDIDFTSRHPFTMHFQGAKHAKKLKIQESLQNIQSQVNGMVVKVGTTFRCDVCGVIANSTVQLQTHLDGVKHKAKVAQMESETEEKSKAKEEPKTKDPNINGAKKKEVLKEKKSVVTILPNVDIPVKKPVVPAANPPKPTFSCTICNVILNSKMQHEQHLLGKLHKAKVEGKPHKKNFVRKSKLSNPAAEVGATEETKTTNAVGTPEVAMSVESVVRTQPVVGILKNKNRVTTPLELNETENPVNMELSLAVVGKDAQSMEEDTESAVATQMVMGVKTLSSSFVPGEILK